MDGTEVLLASKVMKQNNFPRRFLTDAEDPGQQRQLIDKIEALTAELRTLSGFNSRRLPTKEAFVATASQIYAARREVDKVFGMEGFATSPAWDILLDLYVAADSNREISITSACIGAACPPTTGLRWIQVLESMHLLTREQDSEDRRRVIVEITEGAKVKVARALSAFM
jgi:hypothetical protein